MDPETKVRESGEQWRKSLVEASREEAITAAKRNVTFGDVHPGGIAQLYSDHATPLSNLIRERSALAQATKDITALMEFAEEMHARHGAATIHFAVGSASWDGDSPGRNIPVLMRRVALEKDDEGAITLTLMPGVEVNSRLLNQLTLARAGLDRQLISEVLKGPHGFAPATALKVIGAAGEALPGFRLDETLSLGVFTHPTAAFYRELGAASTLSDSAVVAALAGHEQAAEALDVRLPDKDPEDRDPWQELGVGDQTPEMLDAVEVVAGGSSVVIAAATTVELAELAVSHAAASASVGRTVLLVLNDPKIRAQIQKLVDHWQLQSITAEFEGTERSEQAVREKLAAAIEGQPSGVDVEEIDAVRMDLRRSREALSSYSGQLHEHFEPWEVSAFDALQVLTDLTSLPFPPTTRVRLDDETLSRLTADGGERARSLLEEASQLGMFRPQATSGAWAGVIVEDPQQVNQLLDSIGTLVESGLPTLMRQAAEGAQATDIPEPLTLAQWRNQIKILMQARRTLDNFRPQVFERSPADMIVATASKTWRKERSINLKRGRRRQLVRQAQDLVRPGVHVPDLHAALTQAQEARTAWTKATERYREAPRIPEYLDEYQRHLEAVEAQLDAIKPVLEPVYGDLDTLHLEDLALVLRNLVNSPEQARTVPQLIQVRAELAALGLSALVEDFQERRVDGEQLGLELDLAWWASALSYMLSAEPKLGGFDAAILQDHLAQFRRLDKQHTATLGQMATDRVIGRRNQALSLYPDQRVALVGALDEGAPAAPLFSEFSLAWDLLPIVIAGPALVPTLVRLGHKVDTIMTVGLEQTPTGLMVPMLARGRAVAAMTGANLKELPESSWLRDLASVAPVMSVQGPRSATNAALAEIVSEHAGPGLVVGVPSPLPGAGLRFVYAEGSGTPTPGALGIDSSAGEVDAVIDYLRDLHAEAPDRSVGIVALTDRHGQRIASTLAREAAADPSLAQIVADYGGVSNLVLTPEQLAAAKPEMVVLSVGFTKTPHGRIIHDFGVLSTPQGIDVFVEIAKGTPSDLTVVSTLTADLLDSDRLRQPAEKALHDLLGKAQAAEELEDGEVPVWPVTEQAPDQLLVDLADRLHGLGLNVVPNLGGPGSMRIPLAIGHPEVPGRLLVAVLTDDQDYLAQPSLRTRDRHAVKMLEDAGWHVRTQLSMAVFVDPNREANEIVELVLDVVDQYYAALGLPKTPGAAALIAGTEPPKRGVAKTHLTEGETLVVDLREEETQPEPLFLAPNYLGEITPGESVPLPAQDAEVQYEDEGVTDAGLEGDPENYAH